MNPGEAGRKVSIFRKILRFSLHQMSQYERLPAGAGVFRVAKAFEGDRRVLDFLG